MDTSTARKIYDILDSAYPDAGENPRSRAPPFESLIVTILSAQTTDRAVDEVSVPLFRQFPDAEALSRADQQEVEVIIHKTGFYHMKARRIIDAAAVVLEEFSGNVPDTMEDLLRIPGVGRKTANIVLYHSFGKCEGIAVDTHVQRLSQLIGLSDSTDAEGVEKDLMKLFRRDMWGSLTDVFITHGRRVCIARRPKCDICPVSGYCRYYRESVSVTGRKKSRK
jgi:endonuclease III